MHIQKIIAINEAKKDLNAGYAFYELQSAGLGEYFRDCVISDIESLRLYAGIHEKHSDYYRMLSKRFPYAIYYDTQETTAFATLCDLLPGGFSMDAERFLRFLLEASMHHDAACCCLL